MNKFLFELKEDLNSYLVDDELEINDDPLYFWKL